MGEVVGLNGEKLIVDERGACPDVVTELEGWLERARSGEIVGMALAAQFFDGASGGRRVGAVSRALVGQLVSLQVRVTRDLDDG